MIKMMVTGRRKPGLSLAEFDDYWNNHHGPLALSLAGVLRIQRYVQSIRVAVPGMEVFTAGRGGTGDVPDCVAEVWFSSAQDMVEAFNSPEGQAAGARLAEDEEKFCDRSSFVCVITEERVKLP